MKSWVLIGFVAVAVLLAFASGTEETRGDPWTATGEPRDTRVLPGGLWHRVSDGENLQLISRRYYGSSRGWTAIRGANRLAAEPRPGDLIWIPAWQPDLDRVAR